MIGAVARKLFGSANARRIRSYQPLLDAINAVEPEVVALSDDALRARTADCSGPMTPGANELMPANDLLFVIPTHRLRDVGETVEHYDEHFWRNGHAVRMIVFGSRPSFPPHWSSTSPLCFQSAGPM